MQKGASMYSVPQYHIRLWVGCMVGKRLRTDTGEFLFHEFDMDSFGRSEERNFLQTG
jgi:hypothetical protein